MQTKYSLILKTYYSIPLEAKILRALSVHFLKLLLLMENEPSHDERPPFFQLMLNDMMLLLFLGVTIFVVFYIAWGFIELGNVPNMPDETKAEVMSPIY